MGQAFVAMMYGPQAAFVSEMFTTDIRYSGASLGYLGGAFAPIIATALLAEYHGMIWDFDPYGHRVWDHDRVDMAAAGDCGQEHGERCCY